jgi:hypothetical protein
MVQVVRVMCKVTNSSRSMSKKLPFAAALVTTGGNTFPRELGGYGRWAWLA